jgi:hypothetical protein
MFSILSVLHVLTIQEKTQEIHIAFWETRGVRTTRENTVDFDRKTQRELQKLSNEAQRLWEEQRDVLAHARDVAREASRQAGDITKREVLPRAQTKYRETIEPLLTRSPWKKAPAVPDKSSNPFVYVLMAVGAIALAAISYAAWQTLRPDDDLWVEEEDDS